MAIFARLLGFITLISLLNAASGQNFPACSRSDADATTLERCVDTVVFAIRAVLNASDDFGQACVDLDLGGAASEDLDIAFLRMLVCGRFNNQGRFYGNTDDIITELALARVALEVASDESNDPALRYICHGLDLNLYQKFQLPASTIYELACGDLYVPDPPSSITVVPVSSMSSQSQNSSIAIATGVSGHYPGTGPSGYPTVFTTPPPYLPTGYTSTPCTASSTPVGVYRRQSTDLDDPNFWIKVLNSAIFALDLIETNIDDERCDAGDYWIDVWNAMGFFGDYVNALICASAANNTVFPPKTIVQARASLVISLDGIILTLRDPKNIARQIACDNLSYAVLSQAKLDAASIINFVCYSTRSNSSTTGPTTSSNSSTTTTSSSSITTSLSSSTMTTASSSTTTLTTTSSSTSSVSSSSTTSPTTSSTTSSPSISTTSSGSSTTTTTNSSTTSGSSSSIISTASSSSSTTTSSSDTTTSTSSSLSSSTTTTPNSSVSSTSSSSTTSSSNNTTTTSSDSTTSTSSGSSSNSLCSYIYAYGGYRYTCPTTTLDTSFSTTTTSSAR